MGHNWELFAVGRTTIPAVTVVTSTYHTVDHAVAHAEGESYDITDRGLLSAVVACGFADFVEMAPPPPVPATGATAGTPGTWTPAGATVPADLAAMGSVVADPATAWTTGQSVTLGDASSCYWDGAAWVAGLAP